MFKSYFPKNIGKKDRLIRSMIGFILLIVAYFSKSFFVLAFALFAFFESYMSWCVLYHIFGKSSCPIDRNNRK